MSTETRAATPVEVSVTDARPDFARLVRDAEYGAATYDITRHGKTVARLVGPDAGRMPDPDLWQAAQEAYDKALRTAVVGDVHPSVSRALTAFGELLAAHYSYDQEAIENA